MTETLSKTFVPESVFRGAASAPAAYGHGMAAGSGHPAGASAGKVFQRWVVLRGVTHQLNPWRSTAERFVALCGQRLPLDSALLPAPPRPGPDGRPMPCGRCAVAPNRPNAVTGPGERCAGALPLVPAVLFGTVRGLLRAAPGRHRPFGRP